MKTVSILLSCILTALLVLAAFVPVVAFSDDGEQTSSDQPLTNDDINIYFYPLHTDSKGNLVQSDAEGDSYIITVGDVEILVDGGSDVNAATAIMSQMKKFVSADKHWDYIIVTHADSDHIGAFTGKNGGIFSLFSDEQEDEKLSLGTLIDFDIEQDETAKATYPQYNSLFSTIVCDKYRQFRDSTVRNKKATYYTASQCCWKQRGVERSKCKNATDYFPLSDKVALRILYNKYNENKFNPNTDVSSGDKNNLSVCFTLEYTKDNGVVEQFLFTGDLEEYDSTKGYSQIFGETELVKNNPQLAGGKISAMANKEYGNGVIFYKAGHHGSRTSSSESFVDVIRPRYVVIPAVAGNNSYKHEPNSDESFPSSAVMKNLFKYTDYIYIPAVAEYDSNGNKTKTNDYYGYITIGYSGEELNVLTSNNCDANNKPRLIQDTEWFSKYREAALNTFVFDGYKSETEAILGDCTLVKLGHVEILIDCGNWAMNGVSDDNTILIDKVKKYCVDGVLEYVVITSPYRNALSGMVDYVDGNSNVLRKGIFSEFKVENLIDYGKGNYISKLGSLPKYEKYTSDKANVVDEAHYYSAQKYCKTSPKTLNVAPNLDLTILANPNCGDNDEGAVSLTVEYFGKKLLFVGGRITEEGETAIARYNDLNNVVFYRVNDYGFELCASQTLLNAINSGSDKLFIVVNSIANGEYSGKQIVTNNFCSRIINKTPYCYVTTEQKTVGGRKQYSEICGDICFSITNKANKLSYSLVGSRSNVILSESQYFRNLNPFGRFN